MQVRQEAEPARRVSQCDQVLEEGHLHRRAVDQHARVPAESRLLLEELASEVRATAVLVLLQDRYGQRQVGRAEPDAEDVDHGSVLGGAAETSVDRAILT